MKCLIYVTRGKPYIYGNPEIYGDIKLNGKIVAEFDGEVEEIHNEYDNSLFYTDKCGGFRLQFRSCLDCKQLATYLNGKTGYAIHINNLKIFNEPKQLSDYGYIKDTTSYSYNADCYVKDQYMAKVEKAPQNMMKVYDKDGNKYVLISIRPEWACKILNGEKTIEVRRKVLKEML